MATAVAAKSETEMFFTELHRARERVLLLDYDGTIAPFVAYRNRAVPYPTVADLLDSIMSTCQTRVALITGRMAQDIPPLLGLHPHPEIWGTYGIERLHPDGGYCVSEVGEVAEAALKQAEAALGEHGLNGAVERKPGALAVHWRGLNPSRAEEVRAQAYGCLSPVALRSGLRLAEFDGGLELRARVCSKGETVRTILAEVGQDAPVAYLGDDATDEDAFRALNGRGLTVLVRPTYRFTAAQTWIRPPDQLVQFLSDWIRACGGEM